MPDKKTKKKLDAVLRNLPSLPGVYQLIGEEKVLYVGKAKNLKNRVQTYFRKNNKRSSRLEQLLLRVDDIKYIEVDSELEAFILETNLIKELHPKYNVLMKDDKNYAYIKITQNEDYPTIDIVRKMEKDGARYFGPKTSAARARETIDLLHKLFRFRNCRLDLLAMKKAGGYECDADGKIKVDVTNKVITYPCLEYHIKHCDAPCIGNVTPQEYQKNIIEIIAFLEGKHDSVIAHLKNRMAQAAAEKKFEYAAILRDKLLAVEKVQESQKISEANHKNRDIISFVLRGDSAFFNLFVVRDGKLINQENFIVNTQLKGLVDPQDCELRFEILERFMKDFYENTVDFPKEILISEKNLGIGFLEEWLAVRADFKVAIHVPKKGKKSKLLELSLKNAESFAKQCEVKWDSEEARTKGAAIELGEFLNINTDTKGSDGRFYVKRIECFDISHISGHETVASMAVFEDGKPKKNDYRHFTIRTLANGQIDDFKSMEEVIARRLKYLKKVSASEIDETFAAWKGYKIRKAKKDELVTVNTLKKAGGWDPAKDTKGYFLLENPEGEVIGLCCVAGGITTHLKNLCIVESERGKDLGEDTMGVSPWFFMIAKVMAMIESPVIYIVAGLELLEYYEKFGFKPLKSTEVPDSLQESVRAVEKKYRCAVTMKFDKENMYSPFGRTKVKKCEDGIFTGEIFGVAVCKIDVRILDKKAVFISSVEINDAYKESGIQFEVLEKVYEEIVASTFYAVFDRNIAEAYLKNGFEEIKTAPEVVLKTASKSSVILAYYRSRRQKADSSFASFPDLIVVDGGKGQLFSAMAALKSTGLHINLCSLAKKLEDVYVPGRPDPIILPKDSPAQYLLQRLRDEAHRFAITHNRARREKRMLET